MSNVEKLQNEINDLKSMNHHLNEINSDLDRSISIMRKEITELRQKIARYENPDYVLVPRNLSNELWEVMWKEFELSESMYKVHKAMIEVVEKENE